VVHNSESWHSVSFFIFHFWWIFHLPSLFIMAHFSLNRAINHFFLLFIFCFLGQWGFLFWFITSIRFLFLLFLRFVIAYYLGRLSNMSLGLLSFCIAWARVIWGRGHCFVIYMIYSWFFIFASPWCGHLNDQPLLEVRIFSILTQTTKLLCD